ncbi:MucBP domain-containing protein [Candidatus Enterococcus ikei]|uniref:MucBP domain-containing protein n=1 Tax=Candidatus Enterococcus ikei TaxID=2815326 RepID=A0ABS3H1W6_9ENTE|nr:MucBP domain-containing protein [Enterococcus sp. DIV0869a]MBO0441164.1 MucBP domain-containing protein [Enterococcus sp. DIV0869a]
MKKNKRFASLALVTLLAPTLLNAQYVFAEEAPSVPSEQQEVVPENEQPEAEKEVEAEKQPETETEAKPETPAEETKPESKPEKDSEKEVSKPEAEKEVNEKEEAKEEKAVTNVTVNISLIDQTTGSTQSLSITGEVGTTQNVQLPLAAGQYEFVSTSDGMAIPIADATGQLGLQLTFPNSASGIHSISVIVKQLDGITGGNVYVVHLDDLGNELTDAVTILGGFIGDIYTTTPKNIPGYTLVNTPENHTGSFIETDQRVIYSYDRIQTTVSVVCADENGVPLGDVVSQAGKFKDTFTITAPELAGYEYLGLSQATYSNASSTLDGTFGLEDQHFVATYRKIITVPGTPEAPTANIQKATIPNLLQTPVKTDLSKKVNKNLPETGETEINATMTSIGLVIVAAVYFTKKKRENEFSL